MKKRKKVLLILGIIFLAGMVLYSFKLSAVFWLGALVEMFPATDFVFWSKADAGYMMAAAFLIGLSPWMILWILQTGLLVCRYFEDEEDENDF